MANRLAGIFPAIWTPTDSAGNLLVSELRANLEFLKRQDVHGFMALGSTGEFPLLEISTRRRVLEEILGAADELPVMANISDIRPAVVADLGRLARTLGAAAVAVLPPYFFRLAQVDLIEFFVRAAEAAKLPLALYNFPERTGIRIELETIAAVADRVPVVAVKQSGAEFEYHASLVALAREKSFVVFTGSDTRLAEAMRLGVRGCITGMGNATADLLTEIFSAEESNDGPAGEQATARMSKLGQLMDRLEFPLNVAALMEARGLAVGEPKSVVSAPTRRRYAETTVEFRRWFQEWKL